MNCRSGESNQILSALSVFIVFGQTLFSGSCRLLHGYTLPRKSKYNHSVPALQNRDLSFSIRWSIGQSMIRLGAFFSPVSDHSCYFGVLIRRHKYVILLSLSAWNSGNDAKHTNVVLNRKLNHFRYVI